MKILLVEDDSATAQSMELMLKSQRYNVQTTPRGEEAIDLATVFNYDLVSLDLRLPDMSGVAVLRTLRLRKVTTPIMIVTGCADTEMKVRCLAHGADDYLVKPFHKDEWIARIVAIVRRSHGVPQSIVTIDDLSINLDQKIATIGGAKVPLTTKEFALLEALALRKGSLMRKEALLNQLYGGMDEPDIKIIDVFICKLRHKLESLSGGKRYIETVWGRGYALREPQCPEPPKHRPARVDVDKAAAAFAS